MAAVILAAGAGRRFAGRGHKLHAVVRGRAVVEWAVDHAVAAGLDETLVVAGAVDLTDLVPPGVRVVHNPRWAEGIATSLQAAVAHADAAGHDAVVVGLADQPFVEAEAWRRVASADAAVAVATYDGVRANPVRLRRDVWPLLPTTGDEGARVVMRRRPELVREVACPGTAADVDTLEDVARWS